MQNGLHVDEVNTTQRTYRTRCNDHRPNPTPRWRATFSHPTHTGRPVHPPWREGEGVQNGLEIHEVNAYIDSSLSYWATFSTGFLCFDSFFGLCVCSPGSSLASSFGSPGSFTYAGDEGVYASCLR